MCYKRHHVPSLGNNELIVVVSLELIVVVSLELIVVVSLFQCWPRPNLLKMFKTQFHSCFLADLSRLYANHGHCAVRPSVYVSVRVYWPYHLHRPSIFWRLIVHDWRDPWLYRHNEVGDRKLKMDGIGSLVLHNGVMTRKRFLHYWPIVRGVLRWPADSLHKGPVIQSVDVFFDVSFEYAVKIIRVACDFETPRRSCDVPVIPYEWSDYYPTTVSGLWRDD